MNNNEVIEKALTEQRNIILADSNKKVKQIDDYLARKDDRTFDEDFQELKQIFKNRRINKSIWISLIKSKKIFNASLSIDVFENLIQIVMPTFIIMFSLSPENNTIRLNFRSSELRCDYWMREAFKDFPTTIPNNFQEFMEYEPPNKEHLNACKYLNRCEQFKANPTIKSYCKMCDIHYSAKVYITPNILLKYANAKKTANEIAEQALCQVKLANSELEKYEFGSSQIKEFYKDAIPSAVDVLKTFTGLNDRLIIENQPIEDLLRNEILRLVLRP